MTNRPSNDSEAEQQGRAFEYALRVLTRRDHAVAELRRKLRLKGFGEPAIEETLTRLVGYGYLDDRRFARRWAEAAIRTGRGYGSRISRELTLRGVAREIQAEVLEELGREFSEPETLAALVAGKFPAFDPGTASDREKRRIVMYLQRRGFSLGSIFDLFGSMQDRDRVQGERVT